MKKIDINKLLKVLRKVDKKIYVNHGVIKHEFEGQLFCLVNDEQEQEIINYIEKPKDCFDFNKKTLFAYLRQFKDEFIYIKHTEEEIRDVINKLHLEIDDAGWIKYEDNVCKNKICLIKFDEFIQAFENGYYFKSDASDLLATMVRKELENEPE